MSGPLRSLAAVWGPLLLALAALSSGACRGPAAASDDVERARAHAAATLDALHAAAARADERAYFELFAADAVFLGTDPAERWTLAEFRAWARPHFAAGRGWSYAVVGRHLDLAPGLAAAWFDERLSNASYGECRGTGVLVREGRAWKVAQYSLSIPVPNELAGELVERIRSSSAAP